MDLVVLLILLDLQFGMVHLLMLVYLILLEQMVQIHKCNIEHKFKFRAYACVLGFISHLQQR